MPLFKDLKVPTLFGQYIYNGLVLIHRNRDGLAEQAVEHSHDLRSCGLRILFSRLARGVNAFPIRHQRLYNELPLCFRNQSEVLFGRGLKKFVQENPVYSVEEWSDLSFVAPDCLFAVYGSECVGDGLCGCEKRSK